MEGNLDLLDKEDDDGVRIIGYVEYRSDGASVLLLCTQWPTYVCFSLDESTAEAAAVAAFPVISQSDGKWYSVFAESGDVIAPIDMTLVDCVENIFEANMSSIKD